MADAAQTIKPITPIAAWCARHRHARRGHFLLGRGTSRTDRARSVRATPSCHLPPCGGEYNRAASGAKRLFVKVGAVDRQCPASGADKAAKTVKAKADSKAVTGWQGAGNKARTKKTLTRLGHSVRRSSVTAVRRQDLTGGRDDLSDLADLNIGEGAGRIHRRRKGTVGGMSMQRLEKAGGAGRLTRVLLG